VFMQCEKEHCVFVCLCSVRGYGGVFVCLCYK